MATSSYPNVITVPAGSVLEYAGSTAPASFLLCDGSSYLRSDYPQLFAAISTTFGAADGTHFNVPDLRDRTVIGKSGTKALGASGGSADAITVTHAHNVNMPEAKSNATTEANPGSRLGFMGYTNDAGGTSTSSGVTVASSGSSGTGANLPPYLALNKIIKT